jgi:hypothetical protein
MFIHRYRAFVASGSLLPIHAAIIALGNIITDEVGGCHPRCYTVIVRRHNSSWILRRHKSSSYSRIYACIYNVSVLIVPVKAIVAAL